MMKVLGILAGVLISAGGVFGEIVTVDFSGHFASSSYSGYLTSADDYQVGDTIEGQIVYDTGDFVRTAYSDVSDGDITCTLDNAVGLSLFIRRGGVEIASMATLFPSYSFNITSNSSFHGDDPFNPYFYDYSESFSFEINESISTYPAWKSGFRMSFSTLFASTTEKRDMNEPLQVLDPDYFDGRGLRVTDGLVTSQNSGNGWESYSFMIDSVTVVPEPFVMSLLGVGAILIRSRTRRS